MFDFLRLQYQMGKVTKETLRGYVGKWLTAQAYRDITGESI